MKYYEFITIKEQLELIRKIICATKKAIKKEKQDRDLSNTNQDH